MINSIFKNSILSSIQVKNELLNSEKFIQDLSQVVEVITTAFEHGNKIIFAGNGGSAADAQHLAAEFVSRFEFNRPGLPSISLSTDTSMLTAISNDYGYEKLFSRQLQAQAKPGDVFVGITTSGKSINIIEGFKSCEQLGVVSVAMCGLGGTLDRDVDYVLRVPSRNTARIQECHILVGHIICAYVERYMFGHLSPESL